MEEKVIFNKKKIFILGFGFFGISIIWAMYNAYVPMLVFLQGNPFMIVILPILLLQADY